MSQSSPEIIGTDVNIDISFNLVLYYTLPSLPPPSPRSVTFLRQIRFISQALKPSSRTKSDYLGVAVVVAKRGIALCSRNSNV